MSDLTRKDLDDHYERTREANREVVIVLKDVAVQFNTIAQQLMMLAKANEDILTALMERVARPLDEAIRDVNQDLKDLVKDEVRSILKDLNSNCKRCWELIEASQAVIDSIPPVVHEVREGVGATSGKVENVNRELAVKLEMVKIDINKSLAELEKKLSDKLTEQKVDRISNRTAWLLIAGVLTAILTLLGVTIKECGPLFPHRSSPAAGGTLVK